MLQVTMSKSCRMLLRLEKSIKTYIPNYNEFIDILNENCVIYGRYILHFVNDDSAPIESIEMLTTYYNYLNLHKLLSVNRFIISNVPANMKAMDHINSESTKTIIYEKIFNSIVLKINITITPMIMQYIKNNQILKIEQSYFNGSHIIIPYKKEVFTKSETNTKIKISNPIIYKKIYYYIKHGYMFNIINDTEHIEYKHIDHSTSKYITDLMTYKLK